MKRVCGCRGSGASANASAPRRRTGDALTAAQAGFHAAAVLGAQYPGTSVAARLAARADRDKLDIVAIIDKDPTGAGQRWDQRLEKLLIEHGQR